MLLDDLTLGLWVSLVTSIFQLIYTSKEYTRIQVCLLVRTQIKTNRTNKYACKEKLTHPRVGQSPFFLDYFTSKVVTTSSFIRLNE